MSATQTFSLALPSGRVISYALTSPPPPPSSSSSTTSFSQPAAGTPPPTVLLANPLCATFTSWDHVVPKLTARGFRVLRYDQPGHGNSGVPADLSSTTFEGMADDVHAVIGAVGIEKLYAWVGVSMGAATSIAFAAKYPGVVERLVACDTVSCSPANSVGGEDVFGPRVAAAREQENMHATVQGTLERWFGKGWLQQNPEEAERMGWLMMGTSIDGLETCCAALSSRSFDLRPLVEPAGRGTAKKALLLVGEKDANLPETMEELRAGVERGLRSHVQGARVDLHVIRNAGHVCYVDGLEEFVDVVTKFLE